MPGDHRDGRTARLGRQHGQDGRCGAVGRRPGKTVAVAGFEAVSAALRAVAGAGFLVRAIVVTPFFEFSCAFTGNSFPEFLGARRRYLAFSEAVNAFPPQNSRFPCQLPCIPSLTAPGLIAVRPRLSVPARVARGFLTRLSSPGRMPSRGRAGAGLRARTRTGENLVLHGPNATDKRL
jgi:hypothetical protein